MIREEVINKLFALWEKYECHEGKDAVLYFNDENILERLLWLMKY